MSLSGKPLESITEADLQEQVDNQVLELKTQEYKAVLPGNSDRDKKEFIAAVSSFANAAGGLLIYGIRTEKGVPKELVGLKGISVDDEKLRLENMIRDGVAPRIPGIEIRPIPLHVSSEAILIRIPRSWASPHMVTFK